MSVETQRRSADRRRMRFALGGIACLLAATAAIFLKENPFSGKYEISGLFSTATQLTPGSDVRIAGVSVGEVESIHRGPGHTALVTMAIDDRGRPIHRDATLSVEPRLILEGAAYVRIQPGTAGAPELDSGETIPVSRTSVPVQLDQVLDTFDSPTRDALHHAVASLASGLGAAGTGEPSGTDGLRAAVRELDRALPTFGRVGDAARGSRAGDLGNAIRGSRDAARQLAADPRALADLVTNIDRVTGAMADRDRDLRASIRGFARTLATAPAGLTALDRALPILSRTARDLRPALLAMPGPLVKVEKLLEQTNGLVGPRELPRTVDRLRPVTAELPQLVSRLKPLLKQVNPVAECFVSHVIPMFKTKLKDGANTTGDPVYLDMAHAFTGATGAAPSFDGNGVNVRAGVTQGGTVLNNVIPGLGRFLLSGPKVEGIRPTWLGYGVEPPYRPDAPCSEQAMPDFSKRSGGPPNYRAWNPQPKEAGR